MTRITFVTGHTFGCRALEGIISSDSFTAGTLEVGLIVGLDEVKQGATVGFQSPASHAHDIGAHHIPTSDGRLLALEPELRQSDMDYLVVIGWSRLVPQEITALARRSIAGRPGAIGMHPTRLPEGRGRAPIPWTIIRGLSESALTVFLLDPQADAGPVLAQYPLSVSQTEGSRSLFWRFADLHYHAGRALADAMAGHAWTPAEQDDMLATTWGRRTPHDGQVSGDMTVDEIVRTVRAQQRPYPLAWLQLGGRRVSVHQIQTAPPTPNGSSWFNLQVNDGQVWLQISDSSSD